MKTWTKLLVVLLTLAMVLSLVACGGKKDPEETPAQTKPTTTPAATTPEATPEASTPEGTPDASTPEATPDESTPAVTPEASTPVVTPEATTEEEPGKTSADAPANPATPAVTPEATTEAPVVTTPEATTEAPRVPSTPTTSADGNTWIYELEDASQTAITVDGVMDEAYDNGVWLVANSGLFDAADSTTTFNVYMAADATHVYVFYEFIKAEEIFYDETYGSKHHFDCVDFVLDVEGKAGDGSAVIGDEFRIWGAVEGGKDTEVKALAKDEAAAGVDNYYVKHVKEGENVVGYTVEFSVPLSAVKGVDANGNKVISFTALSTVTIAATGQPADPTQPRRNYVYVANVKEDYKKYPSQLVIPAIGTPDAATTPTDSTEKGNWIYEIDKTTETVEVDGVFEGYAYQTGVYLPAVYNLPSDGSKFDVWFTADDENIYVFYEFTKNTDPKVYAPAEGNPTYQYDCVDFCLNLLGSELLGKEFHIYGAFDSSTGNAYADSATAEAGVESFYVKHTDKGYNVEFSIPLEKVKGTDENGDKKISFTALSTISTGMGSDGKPTRSYAFAADYIHCNALANSTTVDNNASKNDPSFLIVKGSKSEITDGIARTDDGRYLYTLNAAATTLAGTDAATTATNVKAAAATNGKVLAAKWADGADKSYLNEANTYTAYVAADAESLYVYFEIKDSNIVSTAHGTGTQYYWNDCAEIDLDVTGGTNVNGTPVRIWGEAEGTNHYHTDVNDADGWTYKAHAGDSTAINNIKSLIDGNVLTSYTVDHTEDGYTVLFIFNREAFTEDKVAMFFSVAQCDETTDSTPETPKYGRVYTTTENAADSAGNVAKPFACVYQIVDPTPAE